MSWHQVDQFLTLLKTAPRALKVLWIAQRVFSMHLGGNRRWVPLYNGVLAFSLDYLWS